MPHRFRYGIYAAAGWGNYGELRVSFSLSIHLPATYATLSHRYDAYNHVRGTVSRSEGY